jgi:hypothetical protein
VWEGDSVGSEVKCGSMPNAVFEVPAKGGVEGMKFIHVGLVVVI